VIAEGSSRKTENHQAKVVGGPFERGTVMGGKGGEPCRGSGKIAGQNRQGELAVTLQERGGGATTGEEKDMSGGGRWKRGVIEFCTVGGAGRGAGEKDANKERQPRREGSLARKLGEKRARRRTADYVRCRGETAPGSLVNN